METWSMRVKYDIMTINVNHFQSKFNKNCAVQNHFRQKS